MSELLNSESSENRQIVLVWDLNDSLGENFRLVLVMAGLDARFVNDEAEAINLAEISKSTTNEIICLLIRVPDNFIELRRVLRTLERTDFSHPVLLVVPVEQKKVISEMQVQLRSDLDLHFCYEDSAIDALNILGTYRSEERVSDGEKSINR